MEIEERNITWKFVLAFLMGSIFAECTSDPISDMLFFQRVSTGVPLSPIESVLYWYYLPALIYASFFILAYILMKKEIIKPRHFVYALLFLAGIGAIKSIQSFGYEKNVALLLFIPFILLISVLLYKIGGEK
jgi:hypothetical protein